MRQHRIYCNIIALLLALSIIGAVGAFSAAAAPGDQNENPYGELETPQSQADQQGQQGQQDQQDQQDQQGQQDQEVQIPEAAPEEEPQQDEWYDYIYNYEEVTSAYEEPEHLGDLPAVTATKVVEATAVAMPTVAVSDASLFSGIIMWLCVALGIAVIVGVLVSKRTRRRGG